MNLYEEVDPRKPWHHYVREHGGHMQSLQALKGVSRIPAGHHAISAFVQQ